MKYIAEGQVFVFEDLIYYYWSSYSAFQQWFSKDVYVDIWYAGSSLDRNGGVLWYKYMAKMCWS